MTAGAHVLVIDDDEGTRQFIRIVLSQEGHQVATAPDGAAALEWIGQNQPDVILLDLHTPVMDGWEFARLYRQTVGPHAPIIVLTAANDPRRAAVQIGAAGFLAKPFDLDALVTIVARNVERS